MAARLSGGRLPRLERPFTDGLLAIFVSDSADTFPFRAFAEALVKAHDGDLVEKLGPLMGIDEVYWDLRLRGQVVTLHRQHYLGVFLCATDGRSERLIEELLPFTAKFLGVTVPSAGTE